MRVSRIVIKFASVFVFSAITFALFSFYNVVQVKAECRITYSSGYSCSAMGYAPGNYCFKSSYVSPSSEQKVFYSQWEVQAGSCSSGSNSIKYTWYECQSVSDPSPCGGGGGGVGPPNKDIIHSRIFSKNRNGTGTFWGPSDASSSISVDTSINKKDWNVSIRSNKSTSTAGSMWSGRMCGRGRASNINANGTLGVTSNSACVQDGSYCAIDNTDGCGVSDWFSGSNPRVLRGMWIDRDDWAPIERLSQILKTDFNQYREDGDDVSVTIPAGMPRPGNIAGWPNLRYDKTYTFNFSGQDENADYKVIASMPGSYFCYNAYGLVRHDSGAINLGDKDGNGGALVQDGSGKRLRFRTDMENPTLGVADNNTVCEAELTLKGGGSVLTFEARKSVIGQVVSMDNTANPAPLAGVTVRLRYNLNNTTATSVTTTTDANGYYRFNEPNLYTSQYYTVDVTSAAPSGHTGSAFAVNSLNYLAANNTPIGYTYRSDSRDTRVGETSYYNQSTEGDVDCSSSNIGGNRGYGRCVFGFTRSADQYPAGQLNVVSAGYRVFGESGYDHAACIGNTVGYSYGAWSSTNNTSTLGTVSILTTPTDPVSSTGDWTQRISTNYASSAVRSASATSQNISYSTANGYKAGGNYHVALTVSNAEGRACSGNPFVNYSSSAWRYCGAYAPTITNPFSDVNPLKPFKTIHIVNTAVNPTVSATEGQVGKSTISWSYPTTTSTSYLNDVVQYRVMRGSTLIATIPATGSRTGSYDDTAGTCGTNYTYRVYADTGYTNESGNTNICPTPGTSTDVGNRRCNTAPTCTMQYRNASNVWVNYTTTLTGVRSRLTNLRVVCTDPQGDSIPTYNWSSSYTGLGTTNQAATTFTTNATYGSTAVITAYARDAYGAQSASVTARLANEGAVGGTAVISTADMNGACLSKTSPTSDDIRMSVVNYASNANGTGRLYTAVLNHICGINSAGARIGNCKFVSTNDDEAPFIPLNPGTRSQFIEVALRRGTTAGSYGINKGGNYAISGQWIPSGATTSTPNPAATVCVANAAPTITSCSATRATGTNNYTITSTASDEWSLLTREVDILNTSNAVVPGYDNVVTDSYTERTAAQMVDANHVVTDTDSWTPPAALPSGTYRVRVTVRDNNGLYSSGCVTPNIIVDRTPPTCAITPNIGTASATAPTVPFGVTTTSTDTGGSGPASASVSIVASGVAKPTPTFVNAPTGTYTTPSISRNKGLYTAYADWRDNAGNVSSCQFNVDTRPVLTIGPSTVTLVDEATQCASGAASAASGGIPVQLTSGATTVASKTTGTGANLGRFNFSSPAVPLTFGTTYMININLPTGYAPCTPTDSSSITINTNTQFAGYPALTPAQSTIGFNVRFYRQEATKWWQAYNGGVHSNTSLTFNYNGAGGEEGMPLGGVVIGDPTGTEPIPQGFDMFTEMGITEIPSFYSGALYSAFGTDPSDVDEMYGVNHDSVKKNWSVPNLDSANNATMDFEIGKLFDTVEGYSTSDPTWETPSIWSFDDAVSDGSAYLIGDQSVSGSYTAPGSTVPVVFVEGNLDIDGDVTVDKPLIVYVSGNVTVDSSVTSINSMFIIAAGNITFASASEDTDSAVNVLGGIYANAIEFDRDLPDAAGSSEPAQRILYNSWLISNSDKVPAEVTESKVYYILTE